MIHCYIEADAYYMNDFGKMIQQHTSLSLLPFNLDFSFPAIFPPFMKKRENLPQ